MGEHSCSHPTLRNVASRRVAVRACEFTTNSVHSTYVPAYVCTHVYLRNRPYMPGAGGAMTQTFYRLFGYALLDNRVDQNAVARVNYRIDSKSCYRG